jgi:hypothetical protein
MSGLYLNPKPFNYTVELDVGASGNESGVMTGIYNVFLVVFLYVISSSLELFRPETSKFSKGQAT